MKRRGGIKKGGNKKANKKQMKSITSFMDV